MSKKILQVLTMAACICTVTGAMADNVCFKQCWDSKEVFKEKCNAFFIMKGDSEEKIKTHVKSCLKMLDEGEKNLKLRGILCFEFCCPGKR